MPKKKVARKPQPWKWSKTFSLDWVAENVPVVMFGFAPYQEENDRSGVQSLRQKFGARVKDLSEQMTKTLLQQSNSFALLAKLAERCDSCVRMYGYIDANLARKANQRWSWSEVITALAYLTCYVQGLEDTLAENRVKI